MNWTEFYHIVDWFSDVQVDPFAGFPSCEEAIPFSLIPLLALGE